MTMGKSFKQNKPRYERNIKENVPEVNLNSQKIYTLN